MNNIRKYRSKSSGVKWRETVTQELDKHDLPDLNGMC